MSTLEGTTIDGAPFRRRVTARTKRLMIRESLEEARLEALRDAPDLEVFEIGNHDAGVRIDSLEPLAGHRRLEAVALYLERPVALDPLRSCPSLRSVGLNVRGAARIDLGPLAGVTSLERLSVVGHDQPALDLAPLSATPRLRSLHVSGGEWRELDLSPLEGLALEHVNIDRGHLTEVALHSIATPALKGLSLIDQELERLDLYPLRVCERLEYVLLGRNEMIWLDVSGVAGIRTLVRLGWPNVKDIVLEDEIEEIAAPALAHLRDRS